MAITANTGVFNLFSPSESPHLKLMIYELGFTHDLKPYYLAGRKEIHDGPVLRLWKDTTTLFTRLHEGADASGPVVGAGTLGLGVTAFVRTLGTMRVDGAANAAERAAAQMRFGRFFLGQLWDSYGPNLRTE
jgi:hypothetical protein